MAGTSILFHIILQRSNGVVGTISADGAFKRKLFGQVVLLDEALDSHRYRAALRNSYGEKLAIAESIGTLRPLG